MAPNNDPMKCVFCGADGPASSVAHIVPESLGGPLAPVGLQGATCDRCNQYFGQKVESVALGSFPFLTTRLMAGIPTKKGKMPAMQSTLGQIFGTGRPGFISVDPRSPQAAQGVSDGTITRLTTLAEVTEPLAVCRLALKIGVEFLAKHFYEVAISPRVAAAREFARRPRRGSQWWAVLRSDPVALLRDARDPNNGLDLSLFEHEGCLTCLLEMPGLALMVPLQPGYEPPDASELPEPEYRIIRAVA